MNKPVAYIDHISGKPKLIDAYVVQTDYDIPLYTHPVKELHLSLQKSQKGELLAVTYTDDEHRIVEVLWEKPPVKELTDFEIMQISAGYPDRLYFARAILRKAQENEN